MKLPVKYSSIPINERRLVREEYSKIQNGLCYFCQCPLSGDPASYILKTKIRPYLFPKGFFNWPIHLHHCHSTDMTIGTVHARCNAYLWQYHRE